MREILFRGKDTESNKWFYGSYYVTNDTTYCFKEDYDAHPENTKHYILFDEMTDWGLPNRKFRAAVIPETVGQYTGLTDKNGKKIFEGDIINSLYANCPKNEHTEKVTFFDGCFMAESARGGCYAKIAGQDSPKHFARDKSVYMIECEIIGNIHDNPELLKGGTDNA